MNIVYAYFLFSPDNVVTNIKKLVFRQKRPVTETSSIGNKNVNGK